MSLKIRLLIFFIVTIVVLLSLEIFVLHGFICPTFVGLDRDRARHDSALVLAALESEIISLDTQVHDWAAWDEMARFVIQPKAQFIKDNFEPADLAILELQFLAIFDRHRQLVWLGGQAGQFPVEQQKVLLRFLHSHGDMLLDHGHNKQGVRRGLAIGPAGPLLLASRPVHGNGEVVGTLIMAKIFGSALQEKISRQTQVAARFMVPVAGKTAVAAGGGGQHSLAIEQVSATTLRITAPILDIFGKDGLIMTVRFPRSIFQHGHQVVQIVALSLFIISCFLFVLLFVLLDHAILRPINLLAAEAEKIRAGIGWELAPVFLDRPDEIGALARVFKVQIERLETIRLTLEHEEERYRELVENANSIILRWDRQGRITLFNEYAQQFFGFTEEEILGRHVVGTIVPEEESGGRDLRDLMEDICRYPERYAQNINENIKKDGSLVWVAWTNKIIFAEDGSPTEVLSIGLDITERLAAEEQLHKAKLAAEEASHAKSQFLANMSHEIRTPMNGIIGLAEQLSQSCVQQSCQQQAETILMSADRLLTVLNDILDFSKIEAGKLELEDVVFELDRQVATVMEILQSTAVEKGIDLRFTIAENVPVRLKGDPHRLMQVLVNLVNNSLKFTEEGFLEVKVTCTERQLEVDVPITLTFTVTDSGIGIPPEKQELIFAAFDQVDSSYTRKYGGTGLGLTISRQLVELMGGHLQLLHSSPSQGTTFSFTVPCKVAPPDQQEDDGKGLSERRLAKLQGLRVLLADDEPINTMLAEGIMAMYGVEVVAVENGYEAVVQCQSAAFDLVLMDVQMPKLDGFAATRQIRGLPGQAGRIPIIAVTAHALKGYREKCLAVGMDGYLSKPFKQDELLAVLLRYGLKD